MPAIESPDALARKYLNYAMAVAVAMTRRRRWFREEARSAALVGLAEAIAGFDAGRGRIKPRIQECVRLRVADFLHRTRPFGYRSGGGASPEIGPIEGLDFADGSPPVGWAIEYQDRVERFAEIAGPDRGDVVLATYLRAGEGTQRDVARRMGKSQARVSVLHAEAVATIRDAIRRRPA